MKTSLAILAALAIVLAYVSYSLGYRTGELKTSHRQNAEFQLSLSMALYQSLLDNDLDRLKSNLEIYILGQVRYMEHAYGIPSGTNRPAKRFAEANAIANRIESNLVSLDDAINDALNASLKNNKQEE